MLKHILTLECHRKCGYCIIKNVDREEYRQVYSFSAIDALYAKLASEGHTKITLTGGEPTKAFGFKHIVRLANDHFYEVYLHTANPAVPRYPLSLLGLNFTAVNYTIHDKTIPPVRSGIVYAYCMASRYNDDLPWQLRDAGFAGLTINEDHRGDEFFSKPLPMIIDFSIRVNRQGGECMNETFVMPNLTIETGFHRFI